MNSFNRRKFLITAGMAATSSVFLKGCLGNPPETGGNAGPTGTTTAPTQSASLTPETTPETTKVKLGFTPIFEAAPLIIAKEKGFFAKYGMTEAEVSKQANWGAARDNVEIGSAGGGIDGGQWQMPMPYLISEGLITKNNVKVPMYVLAMLNTQGNGIAIAKSQVGKNISLDMAKAKDYIQGLAKEGKKFRAAYTFPKANQDFWIRYWLAAGGIDPDKDVSLLTVPAAQTVANMKTGTMEGFSTGDPWPGRLIKDDIGFVAALTAQMWPSHPEEYLGMRADWVDKNPKATKAILKAVMEAQQWCDKQENRKELAQIVSKASYFNVPAATLEPMFMGKYVMGDGQPDIDDFNMAVRYWKTDRGSVSYPYKSLDLWFLTESVRWGFLPKTYLEGSKNLIDKVNRSDIWKEAAKEAGIPAADIPTGDSRGVEKFFDGKVFDPENPKAYLDSLAIKKA
ncbi:MAG: CmpA/NrtA family ABC transporter substrate-binding protein [Snowella sp.]|nr:CmpA/NrtA family ABC transporter substrate-binding protein [Snowella sp.]